MPSKGYIFIERDQIYGMAEMGPKKLMVKLNTFSTYDRLVKDYVGKTIVIDDEHEVELEDLSTYKNRVRVQKVPFEMDDNSLRNLLERYGKVENINTSRKTFGDYDHMFSDERIVWMIVDLPIPSSLYRYRNIYVFLISRAAENMSQMWQ